MDNIKVTSSWNVSDTVGPVSTILSNLTNRERQVIKLVAEGHSNRIIGEKLDISTHTAKFHVNNLLQKLNVENRAALAAQAVRAGLA